MAETTPSVAIITGASSGIGRATALRLARQFSRLVLVARSGENLAQVAALIRQIGSSSLAIEIDLMLPNSAQSVIDQTLERFASIDALLNIAGAVPGLDLFQMTDAQWDSGMALKFHGARRLVIRAWPALRQSRGSIVFISGNAADNPTAGAAAIGAINAAIEALAKAFADRGIADGVQVNCVSPGAILTDRRLAMLAREASAKGISIDEMEKAFLEQARISRFGEPDEIAELIAFLVSAPARYMTGTVLRMDGGEVKSN